jgi:hypothetical protein
MLVAGSAQARLKVQLKLTSIIVPRDTHLAERLAILLSSWTIVRFFSTHLGGNGAIPRTSRPGICERRLAGVYFSDEQEETMAVGKEEQAGEVKVPHGEVIE